MSTTGNNLLACPECDALQRIPALAPGAAAGCVRCGAEVIRYLPDSLDRTLALMVGAAVALVCANVFPLMELEAQGIRSASNIHGLVEALFASGWPSVAILVLLTVIVVPAAQVIAALYLLVTLKLGRVPHLLVPAVQTLDTIWRWGMVEVFLLGAIVSLVKLTKLASVEVGLAMIAVVAYVLLLAGAVASFDARTLWKRVEELRVEELRLEEQRA